MNNKMSGIMKWGLLILVAFIFAASSLFKLLGGEQTTEMAQGVGGATNLAILGVIELVIVVLWLIPRTGIVATLLGVAYIGGAIAVHFVNGQPIAVPVFIEVIIGVAALVRFPELTGRIFLRKSI